MNSNKVCIDASLALTWLVPTQQEAKADALWREWNAQGVELICPPIFHAEVTTGLRKQVYFRRILPEEGEEAFAIYEALPVTNIDNPDVYRKAWELAKEFNLSRTYDMQYIAVAELEDCELWTASRSLADSLRDKVNRIRWVGEFTKKKA